MLFQSYIFILLFLPLCLLGFWGLKRQKLLQLWLIAFSLWFYGAASPYYLLLLLGSIAWNYAFFRVIERGIGRVTERVSGSAMERAEYGMERDSSRKRLLLGIGIAGCYFICKEIRTILWRQNQRRITSWKNAPGREE